MLDLMICTGCREKVNMTFLSLKEVVNSETIDINMFCSKKCLIKYLTGGENGTG